MLSLLYVSSTASEFSQTDLIGLMKQSREKNMRLGITGILLYKDGSVMQVLEGPDDAVHQLLETIRADGRHHGLIVLLERQIEERQFPDWTMAFRDLNHPAVREIPGYSEFLNEPLDSVSFRTDATYARRLIEVFRRSLMR